MSRVSIADVAALAGVSTGTVSNVLNKSPRVSPVLVAKVNDAITKLNYQPSAIAQTLAGGRSRTVGLLLPQLGNSLFVDMAQGAETVADDEDYILLIAHSRSDLDRERRHLRGFRQAHFAGAILAMDTEDHFATLTSSDLNGTPTVIINLAVSAALACSVSSDNEHGGWLAASHLVALGCRRLAFVGGPPGLHFVERRGAGVARALHQHNLPEALHVDPGGVLRAHGWNVGAELAEAVRHGGIDGIVAATDLLAAGLVQRLAAAGVAVPSDVLVVGYDNNRDAWDGPLPLTTVAQPGEAIGHKAMTMLLDEIRDPHGHEHSTQILRPTLVVRASTQREASPHPDRR